MQNGPEKQKFGEPLEDFSLPDLNGKVVSLSQSIAAKKAGVVVFWSGVCSHCVRYADYLNAFETTNPDIALIALASRHGETVVDIKKAVAEQNLRFRILRDEGGVIAKNWYTQQTPRAFLMDAGRSLVYRGAIDNFKYADQAQYIPYLDTAIAQFMKGEPVTKPETASFGCAIQSVYYVLPRAL